jgi:hypothetical protein
VDWFQGRILRGDQVVLENVDGCMRTKPVLNAPWFGRVATHAEQMSLFYDEGTEHLILEVVDGRRWSITVTDREGEFVARGVPLGRG